MLIIPAIDLRKGKVVALTRGAFEHETIYSASPADVMLKWQREGAKMVHVVDLDGALEGARKNLGSLKNILSVTKIPVQFGGGLRTYEAVEEVIKAGVSRVVIGTKALDTVLVKKLVKQFKDKIVVGLDIRSGVIQTHGWKESQNSIALEDFCQTLERIGVKTIICTNIERDGTLSGPDTLLVKKVLNAAKVNVIASGGVSSLEDIKNLLKIKAENFEGVIVGKALYEQRFSLREATDLIKKNLS